MNIFHNFDWSAKSIAKVFGVVALGALTLGLVIAVLLVPLRLFLSPLTETGSYGYGGGYPEATMESYDARATNKLGIMPPVFPDQAVDENAEDYEVKEMSATYRPHDKIEICTRVAALKSDSEIIFESANESDRSCDYRFRVPRERTDEIVALLENLKPEDLSASVYTIQRTIQDNENRVEILKNQLAAKETTLLDAQKSYEELTEMATRARDVESLTKLIDLKINTIDRLAAERLNLQSQLDEMAAEQQRQLQRIATTSFSVSVFENRLVDWQRLGDEWQRAVQQFFTDSNALLQAVSLGLVTWLLRAGIAVVYILVVVGIARVVWVTGKKVWLWKK